MRPHGAAGADAGVRSPPLQAINCPAPSPSPSPAPWPPSPSALARCVFPSCRLPGPLRGLAGCPCCGLAGSPGAWVWLVSGSRVKRALCRLRPPGPARGKQGARLTPRPILPACQADAGGPQGACDPRAPALAAHPWPPSPFASSSCRMSTCQTRGGGLTGGRHLGPHRPTRPQHGLQWDEQETAGGSGKCHSSRVCGVLL